MRERTGSPGEHCESSGEIKDEVIWAYGEEEREGCSDKSNGLPSDGEKKERKAARDGEMERWGENKVKECGVREDAPDRKSWRGIVATNPSEGRGLWQRRRFS